MRPDEVRNRLMAALEADLIGPFAPDGVVAGEQEVLPLPPSRWYLTGFLAPRSARMPDAVSELEQGELGAGSDHQNEDAGSAEPEPKRRVRFPASLGLSVFLPPAPDSPGDGDSDALEVTVSYADY
ncbi:MAG: DNA/RNA helicase, partial [Myxococcota bacterium]